jgi:hypothetical protein
LAEEGRLDGEAGGHEEDEDDEEDAKRSLLDMRVSLQ